MKLIHYEQLASTNDEAKRLLAEGASEVVVVADRQTRGRGATGAWECPAGEGLLMSVAFRPQNIGVAESFRLLQASSLAVCLCIEPLLTPHSEFCILHSELAAPPPSLLTIKWPNDIFYGDKKLCGILIENTLRGSVIETCTIGIGLNLRQQKFPKELEHAVSLCQLTPNVPDNITLAGQIADGLMTELASPTLMADYMRRLYRREGIHLFREKGGEPFEAEIVGLNPDGGLRLRRRNGLLRVYRFKEIEFILPHHG